VLNIGIKEEQVNIFWVPRAISGRKEGIIEASRDL
jgi:hypothetical protein